MIDEILGDRMSMDLIESGFTHAAWQAVKHFPVDAHNIEFVSHSENVTFRVKVRDGETDYDLRLHRPGYSSIEDLESERNWLSVLKENGVSVQDSLETNRGGQFALVDIPGAMDQRYAGMTTWYAGIPLRDFLELLRSRTRQNEKADGSNRQNIGGRNSTPLNLAFYLPVVGGRSVRHVLRLSAKRR